MFVTFQYRGITHVDMYCTLTIETWLKLNMHFNFSIADIWKHNMHAHLIWLILYLMLEMEYGI